MIKIKLMPMLILFASLAAASDQDLIVSLNQNEQEKQASSRSSSESKGQDLPELGKQHELSDLDAIDSFRIQLEGTKFAADGPGDKSLSVIVNPFTVRKRGWYYGSVYWYHRNDNFDARNFFDPVGQPLPEFKRNQFGFTFGAFVTSKMTVTGSYDGTRINRGSTLLSLIPTPQMKKGDFSALTNIQLVDPFTGAPFLNNQIPPSRIHPVSSKMLPVIPDPNRDDPTRNFVNNDPTIENVNTITARIDYEFNRQTKLFGNFSLMEGGAINVASLPEFSTTPDFRRTNISVNLTHSFSPNKVLNVGLSSMRFTNLQLSKQAFQTGLLESLGIEGVSVLDDMDEGYPEFEISGYALLGFGSSGFSGFGSSGFGGGGFGSGSPFTSYFDNYGIESDFAYVHGGHHIGIGGQIRFDQVNDAKTWGTRRGKFSFSGFFTGNSFADFLLGIPDTASRGIGSDRGDYRQRTWELFVKDDWKINPKFTLSMQLRYAYSPFPRSVRDNVSYFYPLLFEPPINGEIIVTGSSRARELGLTLGPGEAAYTDKNDWQPSFGIAYSPFGNNRLVLRASYSIRHDHMYMREGEDYIGKNYPFFYIEKSESPTSPDIDLSNPFTSIIPLEITIRAFDPHLRNPYIQEWVATVQYEVLQNWNLELSYEGRKTTRLRRTIPANVPLPAPAGEPIQPRRPNPDFGGFTIVTSGGSNSSNAFDVQLRRRMTGIFSLQAGFEWSRAFNDITSQPNNPRNLAAERAFYGNQGPLQFNMNYLLDLPVGHGKFLSTDWAGKFGFLLEGWRISGITTIQNGQPFSPSLPGDPNNDGVWGDRPNRIGSGILSGSEQSIDKWFETSHFVAPGLSGEDPQWFGNSGRNILRAPGEQIWDISFLKTTRVSDGGNMIEFRVQLFNAFNNVNFEQPGHLLGTETFGVISNAGDAREIEIAIKYSF